MGEKISGVSSRSSGPPPTSAEGKERNDNKKRARVGGGYPKNGRLVEECL